MRSADPVPHFPPPRLPRRSGGYPIKLMHGMHDLIAMPKHASKLAGRLGARLVMVDGGHLITRECATQVGGRQAGSWDRRGEQEMQTNRQGKTAIKTARAPEVAATDFHSHHPPAHCLQCRCASSCSSWHCQMACIPAEDAERQKASLSRPRSRLLMMQDPHGSGARAAQARARSYRAGVYGTQLTTRSNRSP